MDTRSAHSMLFAGVIDAIKQMSEVYGKLAQSQQEALLTKLDAAIEKGLSRCVELVAAEERPFVTAAVSQVLFKTDVVVVKLSVPKSSTEAHMLADLAGGNCIVCFPQYDQASGERPKAQPDQPDIFEAGTSAGPVSQEMFDDVYQGLLQAEWEVSGAEVAKFTEEDCFAVLNFLEEWRDALPDTSNVAVPRILQGRKHAGKFVPITS
jgi:hypothetical protein